MKKYITVVILSIISFHVVAQEKLELEDVEVLKSFKAKLADTKMIHFEQNLPTPEKIKPEFNYKVSTSQLDLAYPDPKIRPIAIKKEPLPKYYNGHLKLGAGYPSTLYGDAGYNYHYKNIYDFNIGLSYFSLNNTKAILNQKFSDWNIFIDGKYHIKERKTISASLSTKQINTYNFSNKKLDSLSTISDRITNQTGIQLEYGNNLFDENNFTYYIGTGINILTIKNENITETAFPIDAGIAYSMNEHIALVLDSKTRLNFVTSETPSEIHYFHITPMLKYTKTRYGIMAGADFIVTSDEDKLIFPKVEIKFELLKEYLVIDAGIKNKVHINNLHNLLNYNPYLSMTNSDISANLQTKYFTSLSGKVFNIDYSIKRGYETSTAKAQYKIDSLKNNERFLHSVIDTKAKYLSLNIGVPLFKSFILKINSQFINYNKQLSGIPKSITQITLKYAAWRNKLKLNTYVNIESGIKFYSLEKEISMNPLFNLGLSSEYQIRNNLGIFVNIDNLSVNNYERWYGYQQAPFNIIGGIKLKI